MGKFNSNSRGGFGNRSSGSRFGGRSGGSRGFKGREGFGRDRDSGNFGGRAEMHDATCSKCGKRCQVPFRPTGSKPVFCSDCFRQNEKSGINFGSRKQNGSSQSTASSQQFNQINAKLDKILLVLQSLELDVDEDSEENLDGDFEEDDLDSDSDEDIEEESDEDSEENSEDDS